ncbi:hypothetical protein [Haloflavibacter putidus]|uniref:Sensor of ECF-type sigma factor n=1 Tax=Haloflavibacter putidus TaxID=2576776 RepID=A0A507ZTA0_9FLAO|nr:hypothetical protein [Haloflavibacter putidus]TQD39464.1 hypothetical protein FKR84_06100 [Haloflavibacter putidus]
MRKIIVLLFFCTSIFSLSAQKMDDEKIRNLKTAFITDALSLTSQEAEKFWPLYNSFDKRTDDLYDDKWCNVKNGLELIEEIDKPTSEELLQEYISLKEESLALKKEFIKELKEIISAKKILRLKKAEHDFHKMLLKKYRK